MNEKNGLFYAFTGAIGEAVLVSLLIQEFGASLSFLPVFLILWLFNIALVMKLVGEWKNEESKL